MNVRQLEEALQAAGVSSRRYHIFGVSPGGIQGHGEMILEPSEDQWVVYLSDRGDDFDHKYFDTEDEACKYVLDALTRTSPQSGPELTQEEEQRAAALQEQHLADYRELLRRRGLDPDTGAPVAKGEG